MCLGLNVLMFACVWTTKKIIKRNVTWYILQTEDTYIDMDNIIVKKKNVILFCPLFLKFHPFSPVFRLNNTCIFNN